MQVYNFGVPVQFEEQQQSHSITCLQKSSTLFTVYISCGFSQKRRSEKRIELIRRRNGCFQM